MKELVKEVERLAKHLVFKWTGVNGMSSEQAEDAVLEILKEHMVIGKTTTDDVKECILSLKMLLNVKE